jgi:hypothetical protein
LTAKPLALKRLAHRETREAEPADIMTAQVEPRHFGNTVKIHLGQRTELLPCHDTRRKPNTASPKLPPLIRNHLTPFWVCFFKHFFRPQPEQKPVIRSRRFKIGFVSQARILTPPQTRLLLIRNHLTQFWVPFFKFLDSRFALPRFKLKADR